ncbi:hypothetical protein VTN77DRAFT_1474 [Rasamsonia byssochlamydoides]|uniref:uncharacterized protein n=1 Tax=Rasamsonia byssochlamydoides TaxID=89139 RepID=UPI003743037C
MALQAKICGKCYPFGNSQDHASDDSAWLDYLQFQCRVIQNGLKPDNIMVEIEDASILGCDSLHEFQNPLPQNHCNDGRTIYLARNNYGQTRATTGVRITDFVLSVRGDVPKSGCIQAEVYCASEVVVDAGYTYR